MTASSELPDYPYGYQEVQASPGSPALSEQAGERAIMIIVRAGTRPSRVKLRVENKRAFLRLHKLREAARPRTS